MRKVCKYCGIELESDTAKTYCSDSCMKQYNEFKMTKAQREVAKEQRKKLEADGMVWRPLLAGEFASIRLCYIKGTGIDVLAKVFKRTQETIAEIIDGKYDKWIIADFSGGKSEQKRP